MKIVILWASLAPKKQNFAEGKIAIFNEVCIYKRGEYWQVSLWLPKENKYARKNHWNEKYSAADARVEVERRCYFTKKVKRLRKEFGFTVGVLKGSLAEVR